jgi:ankyrin repeat protein
MTREAIIYDAAFGEPSDIEKYVARGLDIAFTYFGCTILHNATLHGNMQMMDYLVGKGFDPLTPTEAHEDTLLHMSVGSVYIQDKKKFIHWCLDHGIHIDTQNRHGRTPLHTAVKTGNVEAVRALLLCGANMEVRRHQDTTLLDWARTPSMTLYLLSCRTRLFLVRTFRRILPIDLIRTLYTYVLTNNI